MKPIDPDARWIRIEPGSTGTIGPGTTFAVPPGDVGSPDDHPMVHLEYVFDYWSDEDLLCGVDCFIVTVPLASALLQSRLTGFEISDDLTITYGDQWPILYPQGKALPEYRWLNVKDRCVVAPGPNGRRLTQLPGADFSLSQSSSLIVSNAAFHLLRQFHVKSARMRALSWE